MPPLELPVTGRSANQGHQPLTRSHVHAQEWFTGDGTKTVFALSFTPRDTSQLAVYVGGARLRPADRGTAYDFTIDGTKLVLTAAPVLGTAICIDEARG